MTRQGLKGLLTQKIYLSLIGVIVTFLVFASYLIAAVLDTPLTSRPKEVRVQMAYTGGLFDGSAVTYRGVKVGKVTEIKLLENGNVEATVALVTTEKIPKDSDVKIRSLSPVGEQYVDFQPKSTAGPYLEGGEVIPASSTQLPETLGATVVNIKALLDQIDADNVQTALSEISTGLNDTGEAIGKMVDQGDLLLKDLEENWPLTERLLTNGNEVLKIAPAERENIATLATSARDFAAFLKGYDPKLRKLLASAPKQFKQLEGLIKDVEALLPTLLDSSITLNDLLAAREPHMRELLARYPGGINTLANTFQDGELRVHAYLAAEKICKYDTELRSATDTTREPLQTNGHCAASFNGLYRGAAHTPAPLW